MDLLQKIFGCYLKAFQNCFNYSDSAMRYEFNYFILVFSVIYFILFFIGFFIIVFSSIANPSIAPIAFGTLFVLVLLYSIVHILPSLALLYRRIKDVFSEKSKLFFGLYLLVWFIQISSWASCAVLSSTISPTHQPTPSFLVLVFGCTVICQICGLIMLGFYIFLMCKKGNL